MTETMEHITLNTGHKTKQPLSAISEEAIQAVSGVLDDLLQGGKPAVPGFPDFWMTGAQDGQNLIVTVWTSLQGQRAPVLTTGVALKSRTAAKLWEVLHRDRADLVTGTRDMPTAPWIADRIEVGAKMRVDALAWTGDLARCIGWTWLRYRRGLV